MVQAVTARSALQRGTVSRVSRALLVGRAAMAALIVAAIAGQLTTSLAFWGQQGYGDVPRNVANYLSFFTVESNILAVATLGILIAAHFGLPRIGRRFDVVLLCVTSFMLVTGIVYNATMRDVELPQGATLDWSNEVLHLVAPLWMLLDWILCPRKRQLHWRDVGTVLIFPLVWLGLTFLRAPKTTVQAGETPYWYPMLDPASYDIGVLGVVGACLAVAAALLVVAAGQLAIDRRRSRARR
ncbi:Pr6Pr family membrane protein [Agrococcus sp. KRD186]|uniref:Pr6Pr family membrane protein n=1 Tax=Agrococcus sp. KRD186 TaxID=2729730 RepID=UPI0019D2B94C|nr:Pr6Pr family membrane protein [Agrococcus sp. KRD186]